MTEKDLVIQGLRRENEALRAELEWKQKEIELARRHEMQWISVKYRLPMSGERVLATDGVFVGEAYKTSADTWRRYDGVAMRDCLGSVVTHWMSLPEPPKEANDGD